MLTFVDKVCHMMYLHELWTGTLLVEEQQSFQKLLPTQRASCLLPTQSDSALVTIHKHRKRKSATFKYCGFLKRCTVFEKVYICRLTTSGHLRYILLYLKHLVESRAAAGDGIHRGRQRFQASLTHVFELQHGFLTTSNLNE